MRKIYLFVFVAMLTVLSACQKKTNSTDIFITLSYTNPVWDGYLADPTDIIMLTARDKLKTANIFQF